MNTFPRVRFKSAQAYVRLTYQRCVSYFIYAKTKMGKIKRAALRWNEAIINSENVNNEIGIHSIFQTNTKQNAITLNLTISKLSISSCLHTLKTLTTTITTSLDILIRRKHWTDFIYLFIYFLREEEDEKPLEHHKKRCREERQKQ